MRKIKYFSVLIITVFFVMITSGCNNVLDSKDQDKATVRFVLDSARTLFPKASVNLLTDLQLFIVTDGNEEDVFNTSFATADELCQNRIELRIGEYTFLLKAKIQSTHFEAYTTAVITNGDNLISFDLKRIDCGDINDSGTLLFRCFLPTDFEIERTELSGKFTICSAKDDSELIIYSDSNFYWNYKYTEKADLLGTEYNVSDYQKGLIFDESWLPPDDYYYTFYIYNKDKTKCFYDEEYFTIAAGLTSEKTIFVKETIPLYQINYNLNGGHFDNGEDNEKYILGTEVNVNELIPIRYRRKFDGWYYDINFEQKVNENIFITGDVDTRTVYAKWIDKYFIDVPLGFQDEEIDSYSFTADAGYMYEINLIEYGNCSYEDQIEVDYSCDVKYEVYTNGNLIYYGDGKLFNLIIYEQSDILIKATPEQEDAISNCLILVQKKEIPENMSVIETEKGIFKIKVPCIEGDALYGVSLNDITKRLSTYYTEQELNTGFSKYIFRSGMEKDTPYVLNLKLATSGGIERIYCFAGVTKYDSIQDYEVQENSDGTFTVGVPVVESDFQLKVTLIDCESNYKKELISDVSEEEKNNGYKEITFDSFTNLGNKYELNIYVYEVFTHSPLLKYSYNKTGIAEYEGSVAPYIIQNENGTITGRTFVNEDSSELQVYYEVNNIQICNPIFLYVMDEDRRNGYKEFTVDSVLHAGDEYSICFCLDSVLKEKKSDTALYEGSKCSSLIENNEGQFIYKTTVSNKVQKIHVIYEDSFNTSFTDLYINVVENDWVDGNITLFLDSPFVEDAAYSVTVEIEDSEENKYITNYTGTAKNNGKAAVKTSENGKIKVIINNPAEDIKVTSSVEDGYLKLSVPDDYSDVTWKVFDRTFTGCTQMIDISEYCEGNYSCFVKGKKDGLFYSESFIFTLTKE